MEADRDAYDRMQRQASDPLGVTLTLTIRLHNNGAMSIEAPIGDPKFCLHLLDEAAHAIKRQAAERAKIIVPGEDVDSRAQPSYA
jgi:hypothetical protein